MCAQLTYGQIDWTLLAHRALGFARWLWLVSNTTPSAETLNARTPKGQNTESHRTLIPQVRDRIWYFIILLYRVMSNWSYHTDTSYDTDISYLDIHFNHNNTPFWHQIQSYWYNIMMRYCIVSYHIILICHLLIQYHMIPIIHLYWGRGINLRYHNCNW